MSKTAEQVLFDWLARQLWALACGLFCAVVWAGMDWAILNLFGWEISVGHYTTVVFACAAGYCCGDVDAKRQSTGQRADR